MTPSYEKLGAFYLGREFDGERGIGASERTAL